MFIGPSVTYYEVGGGGLFDGLWSFQVKLSSNGLGLLKRFEGLELEAYQDIGGVWTIGYGHTGTDVQPGMRISEREAEEFLRGDIASREDAVARFISIPLNRNEFDALVSLVFNIGVDAFRGSTLRRRLNRGDRFGAADALTWWNKVTIGGLLREVIGLTRRRAAERALFLTPTAPPLVREPDSPEENSRVTPVEAPPRRGGIAESRTVQGATVAGGAGVAASTMQGDSANPPGAIEPPGIGGEEPIGDDAGGDETVTIGDDGNVVGQKTDGIEEIVIDGSGAPSNEEVQTVQAQIEFALVVLIVLSVLFVIYARYDDWRNYRR